MFADLYRFGKAGEKSQLEDFTTEALKAVLNAAPTKIIEQIVSWVLEACHVPTSNISSVKEWEWHTQIGLAQAQIEGLSGFIDIALYADNEPIMVFENKVGADFQPKQLERYGKWLSQNNVPQNLSHCLCIINHGSTVPEEFTNPDNREYHIANRAVFSWADWLRKLRELRLIDSGDVFSFLLEAFGEFLEEHNMATDYPTNQDFAALHAFIPHEIRLRNLVDAMWSTAKSQLKSLIKKDGSWLLTSSEHGCYWRLDWCQGRAGSPTSYDRLCVGIRYPDISEANWDGITHEPNVFITLDDVDGELPTHEYVLNCRHWRVGEDDLLAEKSLSKFSKEPDQRGEEILKWIEDRAKELSIALEARSSG